jgi:hypothetical protein
VTDVSPKGPVEVSQERWRWHRKERQTQDDTCPVINWDKEHNEFSPGVQANGVGEDANISRFSLGDRKESRRPGGREGLTLRTRPFPEDRPCGAGGISPNARDLGPHQGSRSDHAQLSLGLSERSRRPGAVDLKNQKLQPIHVQPLTQFHGEPASEQSPGLCVLHSDTVITRSLVAHGVPASNTCPLNSCDMQEILLIKWPMCQTLQYDLCIDSSFGPHDDQGDGHSYYLSSYLRI